MSFYDRLFPLPILNHDTFLHNLLSGSWITLILLIFIVASFYLIYSIIKLKKILRTRVLGDHPRLNSLWTAYQSSFFEYQGSEKSNEYAENYFNETSVLSTFIYYRVINNVSNILVGFGILGTFVGLTYGIANLNFETADAIKLSINDLLAGMGTAFVTSIWGMALSLIFTTIFKVLQTDISRVIIDMCHEYDSTYKINQVDLNQMNEEKERNLINSLFNDYLVTETDEGKQLPKNVFRQLLEESVKQTSSLQSFSDDLGESIEIAMKKIVDDNSDQISRLIEEKLVPVLEDLKHIKQESGSKVIENAVNQLSESMKAMMEDFKTTVTGDTKDELQGLAEQLSKVSDSLINIPETMTDITLQIAETIEALKETVSQNIEMSNTQAAEHSKQTTEAFTRATNDYNLSIGNIQEYMDLLISAQKDSVGQVASLTDHIDNTLQKNSEINRQFQSMIEKSTSTIELIDNLSKKFDGSTDRISEASDSLKSVMGDFSLSISDYLDRNGDLLDHQKEILSNTEKTVELYSQRFGIIESGLKGIFEQIQTGLEDYKETTASDLNKYLSEFSTVLTAAHRGLENNIVGLKEITEELAEELGSMRNNR